MILIIARDVAGAHAVGSVGAILKNDYPLHVMAEDIALKTLPDYGLQPEVLEQGETLAGRFAAIQPKLLLTGTSIQPGIEKEAIALARAQNIPSLALLDSWTNYAARFDDLQTGEKFCYLPDKIATFDQASIAELTAIGIPAERIVLTGNPYFARLQHVPIPKSRAKVRAEFGIPSEARLITFVSEPLADEWYSAFASDYPSAAEIETCLRLVAGAVAKQKETYLIVKLHPIENPALAERVLAEFSNPQQQIIGRYDPLSLAAASDAVIGINTNLLLETALIGLPTYALNLAQFAGERRSIGARFGLIHSLNSAEELREILANPSQRPSAAAFSEIIYPDAVARICSLISDLLQTRR